MWTNCIRILLLYLCIPLVGIYDCSLAADRSDISKSPKQIPLNQHVKIFEDSSNKLSYDAITSPDFEKKFTPNDYETINFGHSLSAFWFKVDLNQNINPFQHWLLLIDKAPPLSAELFKMRLLQISMSIDW